MFQKLLITDYMFVKDRLFASLNLDDKEMHLYDTVANLLERNIIRPDMVIYLQADTDVLMKNIAKRGRTVTQTKIARITPSVIRVERALSPRCGTV